MRAAYNERQVNSKEEKALSLDAVKAALKAFDLENRVRTFNVSSATVELAAQALDVIPARIAKTLSFLAKDGSCIILVAAGDARVDNGKFKAYFGEKAKMLPLEMVEEKTGHPVGGVCPFAVKEGAKIYLDESLRRFDTIFPAAGTAQSAVELHCEELEAASKAIGWVDLCKDWLENAEK
ncbi:MAG: YbaK/EbsC family protein [Clostridia bacterium]|nr:YbaK/EbsC family protein [Clostridia bacterium]